MTHPEGKGYFVNVRRFRYDLLPSGAPAYGMVSAYKDPLGFESMFQADPFFLQHESQTDAAGNTHTGTIDYRVSKLRRIVDPNGHASENVYDAVGRIAAVIKPGDSAAQPSLVFEYWAPGHALPSFVRTSLREEAGQQGTFDSTVYYDGWGRSLQTRVEAEGGQFTVSGARNYNVRGGVLDRFVPYFAATDAYGNPPANGLTFRRSIDAQERELRVVHPDGSATERQYAGLAEEEFDREDLRTGSPHAGTPTRTVRDMQGRLLEVHQRLAGSTVLARYSYDVFGNLTAFRLSGSASGPAVAEYTYDLIGRRIRVQHEDAGPRRTVYDARGHVALRADARDNITEFQYDSMSRPTMRRYPTTGEPPVTWTYCDAGQWVSARPQPSGSLGERRRCSRDGSVQLRRAWQRHPSRTYMGRVRRHDDARGGSRLRLWRSAAPAHLPAADRWGRVARDYPGPRQRQRAAAHRAGPPVRCDPVDLEHHL